MKPYSQMSKTELIDVLVTRGHKRSYLLIRPLDYLRHLAETGQHYDGEQKLHIPQQGQQQNGQEPPKMDHGPQQQPIDIGRLKAEIRAELNRDASKAQQEIDRLKTEVSELRENQKPRETKLEIKLDGRKVKISGQLMHYRQPLLFQLAMAGVHCYLHGPSGTGKSMSAEVLAKQLTIALDRPITAETMAFHVGSMYHDLLGFKDGHGVFHDTPFTRSWTNGGVVLLDELDASGEVIVGLNNALANGFVIINGQRVSKHADCFIIGAGNTIMAGATEEYTGRQRQDKATIDRFAFVEWGVDDDLELACAGDDEIGRKWTKYVQKVRKAIKALGASAPDLLVTPRASINGAKVLRANPELTHADVAELFIWRGCSADERSKVRV